MGRRLKTGLAKAGEVDPILRTADAPATGLISELPALCFGAPILSDEQGTPAHCTLFIGAIRDARIRISKFEFASGGPPSLRHLRIMTSNNDPHAEFIRLLNVVHRRLLAYLVSLLGNRHDAEDVLQKASLTMWRRFDSFDRNALDAEAGFLAWARTVAFYEAKNFQRAAARSRLRFSEELLAIIAEERVADLAHVDERTEALEHCLGKLDEPSQRLVEAAYFEEGSLAKLAEQLGRAPQTLYNKLNIIRRKLAECVTQRLANEGGAA